MRVPSLGDGDRIVSVSILLLVNSPSVSLSFTIERFNLVLNFIAQGFPNVIWDVVVSLIVLMRFQINSGIRIIAGLVPPDVN